MTAQSDLVRVEVLALALGTSMNTVRRAYLKGRIPPPDLLIQQGPRLVTHWRLATLHAHCQELGRRCAALLSIAALMPPIKTKATPLKAA
jgi:hypothetical protein